MRLPTLRGREREKEICMKGEEQVARLGPRGSSDFFATLLSWKEKGGKYVFSPFRTANTHS